MRAPRSLDALHERNFLLLFLGQAVSLLGSGMVGVALAFAVLDLTGSVADLGFVLASRTLSLAVFLLAGGVLADRLPRRAVMLASDLIRFASQGLLAALLLAGNARLWELIVLQAVGGLGQALFMPAVTGLTPQIVEPEHLQQANALRSFANSAGNVGGPAIAGVVVAAVGPGWALAGDSASFGVSAAFLAVLQVPVHVRGPAQAILRDLAAGLREFRSRRWLLVANAQAALMNMLVLAPFAVLGPAVAKRSLGGASAWALIAAAFGVGFVVGSLIALHLRVRRRILLGLLLASVFAFPLALLALGAPAIAIAPFALLAGAQLTLINTYWETQLQEDIPPALLSRVTSVDWLSSVALQPAGFALSGVIAADLLGINGTLWLGAASAIGLSLIAGLSPSVRTVTSRPHPTDSHVPLAHSTPGPDGSRDPDRSDRRHPFEPRARR